MGLFNLVVVAVVVSSALAATWDLPERARGGEAWAKLQKAKALTSTKSGDSGCVTSTWNAPLDHFDGSSEQFKQRFFVDETYYKEGSDNVFLYINGEGTGSCPDGYMATLAPQYNALMVGLEHRFYGESIPNGDSQTSNLKHLTVENALADLNSFTKEFLAARNLTNAKVFAFGGSYPGGLASWYRIQYPDATVGSLSSSGVVNPIVDYKEFDMKVAQAAGNQCADRIRRTRQAFENLIASGLRGWKQVLNMMHCEDSMSVRDFHYMTADSWSMAIQYSHKTDLCDAIEATPEDASDEEFAQAFATFSNAYWGKDFCSGGFYDTSSLADPQRWDANARSWRWQTCYQVAWFNTAPPQGSLRSELVNLEYHLEQCSKVFGYRMFPSVKEMNDKFGGAFPTAHQTFYADFSDDPWETASVQYPVSSDQPYHYAMHDDLGHCSDLHTPEESDSQALKDCRSEFEGYLKKWMA